MFRPFFVSADLPYSVIRGEVVSIPIVVFNYMSQDVRTDITLEHAGDLEFAEVSNEINAEPAPSKSSEGAFRALSRCPVRRGCRRHSPRSARCSCWTQAAARGARRVRVTPSPSRTTRRDAAIPGGGLPGRGGARAHPPHPKKAGTVLPCGRPQRVCLARPAGPRGGVPAPRRAGRVSIAVPGRPRGWRRTACLSRPAFESRVGLPRRSLLAVAAEASTPLSVHRPPLNQPTFWPAELELYRRKKVTVRAQDTAMVSFMVIPRELGYITIKVQATSERASDVIERRLLVKVNSTFRLSLHTVN